MSWGASGYAGNLRTSGKGIGKSSGVPAGLAVVLLAGYLVLCGTVCQGVMLPNTYVNGHDIAGLTREEAAEAVRDILAEDYASISLTVAAEGQKYTVDLTGALDLDAGDLVQEAYAHGHSGFFGRGMVWILSHLKSNARNVLPQVSDEKALEKSIADSGVLQVDTAVADSYQLIRSKDHLYQGDQRTGGRSGAVKRSPSEGGGPGSL